ncbi:hypothetical protein [Arhodomonas sp. SL1]|uniref:hypothetical protein n=1 Tax=Arhodomonas sp. SL1 TaxID=3425691 RepID=UPI003F88147D
MAQLGRFTVDHLVYGVYAAPCGPVALWLEGGYSPRKGSLFQRMHHPTDPFGTDYATTDDVDLAENAWAVFNAARPLVLNWIHGRRPAWFFIATVSQRKQRIFRRMAHRALNGLPDYELQEVHGRLYFFRQARGRAGQRAA